MKLNKFKRFLASALVLCMLVGLVPANAIQTKAAGETTSSEVVDAAIVFSDLHTSKSDYKESTIKGIFGALKNTGLKFSSVTSGGDAFSVNESSTNYTGRTKDINDDIRTALGNGNIPVNYVWSDHDRSAVQEDGSTLLDKTSHLVYGAGTDGIYGTEDDGNYYVYALSMADLGSYDRYSAGFNDTARAKAGSGFTVSVEKAIENFTTDAEKLLKDRPLFIVSHQPLFNRRNDNAFAELWFDAINTVADKMDVAFFFGHNHNYDKAEDYYYAKGTQMPVATKDNWKSYETGQGNGGKPSVTLSARTKILNFTHMCMGYMSPATSGSTTRKGTAVAITIYKDSIKYTAYNSNGVYTGNYALNKTVTRDHPVVESEEVPVEKATLEAAIVAAEALNAEDYVDFTAVSAALAAAKAVDADEKATQQAVDEAVEVLNAAISALEEKEEEPDTPDISEDTEITVGNTTVKVSGATVKTASAIKDEDKALIDAMNYEEIRVVDIDAEITGEEATLGFYVPVEWQDKTDRIVGISVEGEEVKEIRGTYADGFFTFNVSHFSAKGIALVAENGEAGDTENVVRNDYPEYPNEGAVKVNKTGTGIDFQSSGIAQVEVSASGVPVKKGADLIIMLDTSSSMTKNNVTGTNKTRAKVLEESLANLITQLKTPGDDGEPLDINVAIADFNGYYGDGSGGTSGTPYDRTSGDYVKNGSRNGSGYAQASQARVYTGSKALDKDAFLSVDKLADTYTLNYTSGTNYDYAFDAIYQLGTAIKAANTEERDLYVIFMSDGASLQWNYFGTQNTYTKWNNWLAGTWKESDLTTTNLNSTKHSYFYDLNDHDNDGHINEHRMANAIKGDPESQYEVIRKSTAGLPEGTLTAVNGKEYLYTVPGLGATMFTINFDAKQDGQITVDSIDKALASTASDQTGTTQYYYKVTTATQLTEAFDVIGSEIAYAASNARFVDQMGDDYNLQMKTSTYTVVNGTSTTTKTVTPKIEIISYDIYTKADADAGKIPTGKHIGDRKGTFKTLETVTFNADGTEAYSDQIDGGGMNILADGTQEGYVKGVIYAKTFLYNTNVADVAVNGVNIPTGTNEDGTTSGSTNVLPSETFYWKMGNVQTSELAMRYYVYLEGSMEGTKPAGSYPTNEYANLYYDNYLGNPCQKPTVSPMMAWKEANVSYAFYLVDENGDPIVNQTTGQTGTFANKIAVTNPVVYKTVTLNSSQAVEADVVAKNVLPEGYTLYDATYDSNGSLTDGATYEVEINSNSTGSWTITSKKDNKATTYVTQYNPADSSAYSNVKQMNTTGNDYTHTVVWFAVVWSIQAIPDTVVIDYGLPVDISVLSNDMFGENGKLAAVGANRTESSEYTSALAEGFTNKYTGTYGTATANTTTGKVRYTPANMQMNGYDKFAYAVNYTGAGNKGYYYDTVTVIPATTIYYEDDFVTYDSFTWNNDGWTKRSESLWSSAGTKKDGATQGEDRPGKYSLSDANNIYGYDSVNKGMSTHSLGSAKKATVDYDNYAQASFTFYGTGFDIISMTSNMTGTILVDVEKKNGDNWEKDANFSVDTYYGYQQVAGDADKDGSVEEGEMIWVVDPDSTDSLYQVPVIKMVDKPYGQYRVTIKATYDPGFDHVDSSYKGKYDFYLDAIRIYDPANDGAVDNDTVIEDAYKADGEGWPSYIELRNKLIEAKKFGGIYGNDDETTTDKDERTVVEGLVFIDGDESVGDAQLADYVSYGPNNEVYLKPDQRVAFMVDAPENLANLRIGIKSADGQLATYTITNIAKETSTDGKVEAGAWYNARTYTVDTATDMYYDLTPWKGDIIVISNTGNNQASTGGQNTEGIISLTNIKSTYTSNPNANARSAKVVTSNETSVYMTPAATALTLKSLNKPVEEDKEEVVKATAEILSVTTDKASYTNLDTVKVTVKTNDVAEYVTVNGKKITEYKEEAGVRSWSYSVKTSKIGKLTFKAVAYNEADEASEEVVKSVTVKKFAPKTFKLVLNKKNVIVGEKVKATVTTSTDVKYVTINGKKVTKYTSNKTKGTRTWALEVKATKAGKMTFKAVAYNTNNSASKEISATATAKKFAPKTFKLTLSKSTVKKGQQYTVTVTASTDVKYVTVNGKKITKYTSNKAKTSKTFKVTYKAATTGKKIVKVIAYNKNGSASNPKTKTVTVKK